MTIEQVSPEVIAHRRANIRRYADLMDSKFRIPGTKQTFGIDPIVGLIPGAGGIAGFLLSVGIVVQAVHYGARRWTLTLMLINLFLDATIGSIPVLGTVFDVVYKANNRNVNLLDHHVEDPYRTNNKIRSTVFWSLVVVAVVTLILLILLVIATIWLISWLTS
ncbi:MAG: DUF4112 domain-containing protein [Nocardiaceae bacterium]|nr:DUF4112 domain-containing protein [Nocardiaceae bacterium]